MEANNIKEMREALERFADVPEEDLCELEKHAREMQDHCVYGGGALEGIILRVRTAKNALSAPPRNCDVGTAEEQLPRFRIAWEAAHRSVIDSRSLIMLSVFSRWEQLSYEATQEGGK